jgi:hypothetical protein
MEEEPKGLGDRVEDFIKLFGIKSCDACKRRKEWLNNTFSRQTVIQMEEDELIRFEGLMNAKRLESHDVNFIEYLYYKTFNIANKKALCRTCPKIWINIISELKKVYIIQTKTEE